MATSRKPPHILIVEARFYDNLADALANAAIDTLKQAGATWERIDVPGAFEIPAAIRNALEFGAYDGYVALGCVIRGETSHYDHVCHEAMRGLNELALHYMAPIGNGIVTVENREQAEARCMGYKRNTGAAAVRACLRLIELQYKFGVIGSK